MIALKSIWNVPDSKSRIPQAVEHMSRDCGQKLDLFRGNGVNIVP